MSTHKDGGAYFSGDVTFAADVDIHGTLTGNTDSTSVAADSITLTLSADPPSPAVEGMIYADTDHHIYYYNGTTWKQLDN